MAKEIEKDNAWHNIVIMLINFNKWTNGGQRRNVDFRRTDDNRDDW